MDSSASDHSALAVKKFVTEWVSQARAVLIQLGGHVKALLRIAHQLVTGVIRSKESLLQLEERMRLLSEGLQKADVMVNAAEVDIEGLKQYFAYLKSTVIQAQTQLQSVNEDLGSVLNAGTQMDASISHTTQAMMNEARMMQDLGSQVKKL